MQPQGNQGVFMTDSHARSVTKGMSWRVTATLDTILLAFLVTGTLVEALKIGFTEILTKVGLYYLHERLWNVIPFGRIHGVGPTHARSLVKGVSWRVLGTLDTIVISFFITGQWRSAVTIGAFEVITKIALYYLHERAWGSVKWGRIIKHRPSTSERNGYAISQADMAAQKVPAKEQEFIL